MVLVAKRKYFTTQWKLNFSLSEFSSMKFSVLKLSEENKSLTTLDQWFFDHPGTRPPRETMPHGIMGHFLVKTKMAAAVPFNVVFGINETPLTHALETRRFDEALEYINSRYGMCLDEGFYQRIPLYIVLSGENSAVDGEAMPIHLKIARRLIERGEISQYD